MDWWTGEGRGSQRKTHHCCSLKLCSRPEHRVRGRCGASIKQTSPRKQRRLLSAEEEEVRKPRPFQSNARRTKKINLGRTTYNTTTTTTNNITQQQRRKSVLYEKPRYITKEWSCNCVGKSENAREKTVDGKQMFLGCRVLRENSQSVTVLSPFVTGSHSVTAQLSRRGIRTRIQRERTRKIRETSLPWTSLQEQGKSIRENYEPGKYALQNEPCGGIEEEQGWGIEKSPSLAVVSSQLRMVGNESECEFSLVVTCGGRGLIILM